MGVGSILSASEIYIIAYGEHKAQIVAEAVEGEISPMVSASFLQEHPHCRFMLDISAAQGLTRFRCPWLVEQVEWTDLLTRKGRDLARPSIE